MPDGRIGRFEVPEGTTEQQVLDFVQSSAPAPDTAPLAWSDVPLKAIENLPGSFGNLVKNTVTPIISPVETGKALYSAASGAAKNIASPLFPVKPGDKDVETANAIGKFFMDRYGSEEGWKKAMAEDPAGVLADISAVLSMGGGIAARLPGAAGAMGGAVKTAGRVSNPISLAFRGADKLASKIAEPVLSNALGVTTGAGAPAIREAAKAGLKGGDQLDALTSQMRGTAPIEDVVSEAKTAVNVMKQQRGVAYRASSAWKSDAAKLKFAPVEKAYQDLFRSMSIKGESGHMKVGAETTRKLNEIGQVLKEWKGDPALHTVEGFDALKQRIDDLMPPRTDAGQSGRAVTTMRNAVKDTIVKQAPAYAKTMREYEVASELIKDVESSLSLGKKANVDTALRKLQSVMRNNANTNYGRRAQLGQTLVDAGAETLMPKIAGQMLSSATPRGLQALGASGAGITALMTNPSYLPGLAFASPRIVGEGALLAGKAARPVKGLLDAIDPVISPTDIAALLYQSGRVKEQSEPLRIDVKNRKQK